MNEGKRLAICIPTFNRLEELKIRLIELSEQSAGLLRQVQIYIFDNGSSKPVLEEDIPENLKERTFIKYRANNVGVTQNIIRCYEETEVDLVALLGDDDRIKEDYLSILLERTNDFDDPRLFGICFFTNLAKGDQHENQCVSSIEALLESVDKFANFLFISTWLVRRSDFLRYLYWAQIQSSGGFAIIAPHLMALCENSKIKLSSESIVSYEPTPLDRKWSWFKFLLNANLILELPLGLPRRTFCEFGNKLFSFGSINLSYLYECLLDDKRGNIGPIEYHSFRKLCFHYGHFCRKQRVPHWVLLLGLRLPFVRPLVFVANRVTRSIPFRPHLQANISQDRSL